MWHSFQQQPASVIIYAFNKIKLLPLPPPNHDINTQACLAAAQTPSGAKSEETKDISRASIPPGEVEAVRNTEPIVILRLKGV